MGEGEGGRGGGILEGKDEDSREKREDRCKSHTSSLCTAGHSVLISTMLPQYLHSPYCRHVHGHRLWLPSRHMTYRPTTWCTYRPSSPASAGRREARG